MSETKFAPCESCARPITRGTIAHREPVSRIAAGSPDLHRILLQDDQFGAIQSIVKSPRRSPSVVVPTFDASASTLLGSHADRGQLLFEQDGVDLPSPLDTTAAYDLRLHAHSSDPERAILVVTTWLRFAFMHADPFAVWSEEEQHGFVRSFLELIPATWAGRHDLVDVSGMAQYRRISVEFDIAWDISDERGGGEHWYCYVWKESITSNVRRETHRAHLDSKDFKWKFNANPDRQMGAAHEYGHMLGLADEYKPKGGGTFARAWLGDVASIMNHGGEVRERHYAPFAHWVTQRFAELNADFLTTQMEYKVNGTTDLANASLNRT